MRPASVHRGISKKERGERRCASPLCDCMSGELLLLSLFRLLRFFLGLCLRSFLGAAFAAFFSLPFGIVSPVLFGLNRWPPPP